MKAIILALLLSGCAIQPKTIESSFTDPHCKIEVVKATLTSDMACHDFGCQMVINNVKQQIYNQCIGEQHGTKR